MLLAAGVTRALSAYAIPMALPVETLALAAFTVVAILAGLGAAPGGPRG